MSECFSLFKCFIINLFCRRTNNVTINIHKHVFLQKIAIFFSKNNNFAISGKNLGKNIVNKTILLIFRNKTRRWQYRLIHKTRRNARNRLKPAFIQTYFYNFFLLSTPSRNNLYPVLVKPQCHSDRGISHSRQPKDK